MFWTPEKLTLRASPIVGYAALSDKRSLVSQLIARALFISARPKQGGRLSRVGVNPIRMPPSVYRDSIDANIENRGYRVHADPAFWVQAILL